MKDSEIRKGGYYVYGTDGIVQIVGSYMEGSRGDRRKVYEGRKPGDKCNYCAIAHEFTREATRAEYLAQSLPRQFRTSDGFTFTRDTQGERILWTDGEQTYNANATGWPVDANGEPLDGDYLAD